MSPLNDATLAYAAHLAHQHGCAACNSGPELCPLGREYLMAWGALDAREDVDLDDCAIADPAPWFPELPRGASLRTEQT